VVLVFAQHIFLFLGRAHLYTFFYNIKIKWRHFSSRIYRYWPHRALREKLSNFTGGRLSAAWFFGRHRNAFTCIGLIAFRTHSPGHSDDYLVPQGKLSNCGRIILAAAPFG
jgi:hypothetical protein